MITRADIEKGAEAILNGWSDGVIRRNAERLAHAVLDAAQPAEPLKKINVTPETVIRIRSTEPSEEEVERAANAIRFSSARNPEMLARAALTAAKGQS